MKFKQTIILKIQIEYAFLFYTGSDELMNSLITEECFTGAAHTNNNIRLARCFGKHLVSSNKVRQLPFMEIIQEL